MGMTLAELQRLLSGLPLPAMLVRHDDQILAVNAPGRALLGEEVVGRHPAMAVRTPSVLEAISTVARAGGVQEARMTLRREGQEAVFQVTVSEQGGITLCIFRDVTEEERAGEMRRDFVANVSHELRTPLATLEVYIDGLEDDVVPHEEKSYATMRDQVDRLRRLSLDLREATAAEEHA